MILATDTSGRIVSTALLTNEWVREAKYVGKSTESSHFFKQVDWLLKESGEQLSDVQALAIGSGPGSFTGLRISFSGFRAFSQSYDIPLILINSLDAIVWPWRHLSGIVVVAQRARRGFAFCGFYQLGELIGDYHYLSTDELMDNLAKQSEAVTLVGSFAGDLLTSKEDCVIIENIIGPTALDIAKMAKIRFDEQQFTPFEDAQPYYMRRSDAEIMWEQKENEKK